MFAEEYTPTHRGFDSHYGYFQGAEGFFDHTYEANQVSFQKYSQLSLYLEH